MKNRLNLCRLLLLVAMMPISSLAGCSPPDSQTVEQTAKAKAESETVGEDAEIAPAIYVLDPDKLLSAALPVELLEQGWVRLFDGQSLAGWSMVGKADWQVENETIVVTRGERSYLCTNFLLADYELQLDFRCDPETNSGVFLRTGPEPQDVAIDCLELNIAPPDNPFPTGSLVQRQRVDPSQLTDFDPQQWHTFRVRLLGEQVTVFLDDQQILEIKDTTSSYRGHISLQHNAGRAEFRNILLRPVESKPLKTDSAWANDWVDSAKPGNSFEVSAGESGLHIKGGLAQLQSKSDFGDFILQAKYSLARPEVNSGIFFRCIRDAMLDGYECQLNHAVIDGDPLQPADYGAGGIFRREPARIVVGDGTQPTYLTLLTSGQQMMTWVNGIQVAEFIDSRPPDENPRKGLRTEAGPIAIQGHDPSTELTLHELKISPSR